MKYGRATTDLRANLICITKI